MIITIHFSMRRVSVREIKRSKQSHLQYSDDDELGTRIKRRKQICLEDTDDEVSSDFGERRGKSRRIPVPMTTKREKIKNGNQNQRAADRLSSLPDDLLIRILSLLDTKQAVQFSLTVKKKWVNLWTLIPDLDFRSDSFKSLDSFNLFVREVLALRDNSVQINKFNYKRKGCNTCRNVVKFIVSHQVQHLNFAVYNTSTDTDFLNPLGSCDSFKSFKLRRCSFDFTLSLKQVVTVHLEKVDFNGSENFSGCPNLKTLALISCYFRFLGGLDSVNVVAPQLSRLTISNHYHSVDDDKIKFVLSTPRLSAFMIDGGFYIPSIETDAGLALLETIDVIVDTSYTLKETKEKLFRRFVSMMKCFSKAKSLRLSMDIVELLSGFPDVLEVERSPFCNLKTLVILDELSKTSSVTIPGHVTKYLLGRSPDTSIFVKFPRFPLPKVHATVKKR